MTSPITDVNVYAMSAAVLYIKFLASTMIQGRKAFAAGTRMAEDIKLPMAKTFSDMDTEAIKLAADTEMRWKRIIQNDLESMPMAFVIFWAAISVGVNSILIRTLLVTYTIARVAHTVVYLQSMPRARMALWIAGMLCIVVAALPCRFMILVDCWGNNLMHSSIPQSSLHVSSSPYFVAMLGAISDIKVFAVSASILYVKFLASSMIQARKSFAANTRMAEDRQLVCAMGLGENLGEKQLKIALDNEQRWKRIIQNDLESIPLAFLVFWSAIAVGVSPDLTKTLMLVYTTARVGHTLVYSLGMPRARMACWMSGTGCILTAAVNAVMTALAASVLYIKFLLSTMIQGRKAFAANTRLPEDKNLETILNVNGNKDDKTVKKAVEDEMRWKRIIQNDLESLPLALIVFWCAIVVGVNPDTTKTLLVAYTGARMGHTIVYALGMPRARMACWMSGTFCIVAAAANTIVKSLS
ncbi:hypothetical protein BBO99_00007528 [Phytophthora kernoviae]|uniref:Microsomal glutathione S-transferase 1 n=2 Tax=Phytophthora kernoviae TaxID=325452 RepID=A0A421GHZ8_9STRA|nr:hypothetical protein G195_008422 [Phytophthora kernoviae 00238/432]KAG2519410.1 hypothetical protein JM16_007152 [Phytophthora kernoviae]KAG2520523.1 hypothetical protein JM18_007063 [Phytophthora kernoviae]RLN21086.1 hypothetical protein BBI17_007848 [Phytophthora kernoviae]RLN76474.1 hypothetical protein BBO99_00007528 [Phytophthora kernoviae]